MALLQTSLIWAVYGVVVAILLAVASVFIYVYQTPRDRSPSVTLACIISITSLLATVLLLPVDVALVSSTTSSKLGQRKDWATQDVVDRITYSLTIIYYFLYSLEPYSVFWSFHSHISGMRNMTRSRARRGTKLWANGFGVLLNTRSRSLRSS
jgi:hypothetical protein